MRWGRKNRQEPQRTPHPDPRMEAELQKVLMLRRMADGYEEQIGHYMDVVDDAQDAIDKAILNHGRNSESLSYISAKQLQQVTEASERRASRAEERISALRGEMRRVHEEIAELIAKLPDTDLAFLEPAPL
jgi:predicted  nucleic acid-binding Zn-ribbon protein